MILAGDVGGTKTRLALFEEVDGTLARREMETFRSKEFSHLRDIIHTFLNKCRVKVEKACFGVPGPVVNGEAKTTNLPWNLCASDLSTAIGRANIELVNDLAAMSAAIPHLRKDDLYALHEGKPAEGAKLCAVLAPGTGLGQAFLLIESGSSRILASEGGHVDFAPTNDLEAKLLAYLGNKFKRVSYERVLSGPGLVNIYSFLRDTGYAPEPPELEKRLHEEDPAAVISETGLDDTYLLCTKTIDIFSSVLGSQAGNLVLTLLATGGVYLGGGIPPKIMKKLADGTTVAAYFKKGRLSDLVQKTPLYVIKNDQAPLLGAAFIAKGL